MDYRFGIGIIDQDVQRLSLSLFLSGMMMTGGLKPFSVWFWGTKEKAIILPVGSLKHSSSTQLKVSSTCHFVGYFTSVNPMQTVQKSAMV